MKTTAALLGLAFVSTAVLATLTTDQRAPNATAARGPDADKPHPSWVTFRWQQRLDEHRQIAPEAMQRAALQRERLVADGTGAHAPAVGSWQWLGPGNVGGRIRSILVHPTQQGAVMWVGAVSGGVWKTVNAGSSWFPVHQGLGSLIVGCMALDPSNPDRIYAGTGEGFFEAQAGYSNSAPIQGSGIYVSTDGGTNWQSLPATRTWAHVNRIAVNPTNSQILLAATDTGIHRSTDGGTTWSRRTTERTFDVDFHPTDGNRAIAGTGGTARARRSLDGGITWTNATGITGARRVELAYARSTPNTIFATSNRTVGSNLDVWRSTDGGVSFTNTGATPIPAFGGDYINALWVDPVSPQNLLVGGIDTFRSVDGGATFASVGAGIHADNHVFVEHPNYGAGNRTVFGGTDGGIYRATDVLTPNLQWNWLNNQLGITQFYGAAMNANGILVGGTQDWGILRYSGTLTWTQEESGDGGFVAADPSNANYFYCDKGNLQILRSSDAGLTLTPIAAGIVDTDPNPYSHLILDPNDPNRLLVGGKQLWRTNNARAVTPTWTSIKPASNCPGSHGEEYDPCNISTVAVAEGNANIIWVGHNNGEVWKTVNGTAVTPTWTRVDTGTPGLPDRWVSRIAIDRNDHDRVYVSFMGYTADNLWRTSNGGQTWVSITGSGPLAFPAVPACCITLHRNLPGWLYVGTDLGLFWSIDDGFSWLTTNDGPGLASVDELSWKDARTLIAVTHGRGVFTADTPDARTLTVTSTPVQGFGITVSPADMFGRSSGDTRFTRAYPPATNVTLTAPNWNSGPFSHWRRPTPPRGYVLYPDGQRTVTVAPTENWTMEAVYLVRYPGSLTQLGQGCLGANGRRLSHTASGTPDVGQTVTYSLSNGPANAAGFLVLGFSTAIWAGIPLPWDLGALAPGCTIYNDLVIAVNVTTSAAGNASVPIQLANGTNLIGGHHYTQFWALEPGLNSVGLSFSNTVDTLRGGVR